ncbi:MAG: 5-methyltetrahydropteroyltriglutamate--homocysteine S-methyltransferase [Rickettsiales bacterium]|nr:5-methyltetrahydropteroyltriglutamate--homocysteine S-methyltransferase [Rickettsiales bacterium]
MVVAANLGFPRIGLNRELKKAVEAYWKGQSSVDALQATAKELRMRHWKMQQDAGIDVIPSNDFSFYDQILDMTATLGAIPARYKHDGSTIDLDTYFAMARGRQQGGVDVVAMEMTKWFDTNYHYIVPEFTKDTSFKLSSTKAVDEYKEAKAAGIDTRPVIIGPVTYLLLGKAYDDVNPLSLLDKILPVYAQLLQELQAAGCSHVQIDEPMLVMDLDDEAKAAFPKAYGELAKASSLKLWLTTYFGYLRDNLETACSLPVDGLHIDLVRAPEQLDVVLDAWPKEKGLSLGVIDGRNIWKNKLEASLDLVQKAIEKHDADKILVAPSCSLLHSPVDLDAETKLDAEFVTWLSFAKQKLDEIVLVTKGANEGYEGIAEAMAVNKAAISDRATSARINNPEVKARMDKLTAADATRKSAFDKRIAEQQKVLNLPPLPTTSIGSLPQTQDVRQMRAQFKKGDIDRAEYDKFLEQKTAEAIKWQDEIGIDVPVHGEYERNDMVEYFGEKLEGVGFTQNGWVQSYGSRCVKPPVIFGDVSRPEPMTVRWATFAQSQTERPMKGMLTGPVTILQWSFVRDDQPREATCKQIALAIRDEVCDLEKAGIKIIQIDEAAFREGLPLREADRPAYLNWATESFRIATSGVEDKTQIHTHMCYSEFNDIIASIADMDADVISIETSRSAMELLDAFVEFKYPNEIGPGVYDIHSPRIPDTQEMVKLMQKALQVLDAKQLWINPDCGLKTRGWDEVRPALQHMVAAAQALRQEVKQQAA